MTPEEHMARFVAAELLTYARDVEAYAAKHECPELLRWAERIREEALAVDREAKETA